MSIFTPFPLPLTGKQKFYLGILQGLGAGIIDGGANFGIAFAMYHNQKSIKMWVLAENTLAGDLGVTPIIQCLASMIITSTLVHTDLHHREIQPLAFVWPHVDHLPDPRSLSFFRYLGLGLGPITENGKERDVEKTNIIPTPLDTEAGDRKLPISSSAIVDEQRQRLGIRYYPLMLVRFIFEGTESNSVLFPSSSSSIPTPNLPIRFLLTAAQGALLGIVTGLPIFLLFVLVVGPLYGHENIAQTRWKWSPMVIKAVYGAVLGWITNPIIASMALGSQAERHLIVLSNTNEDEDLEAHTHGEREILPITEEQDQEEENVNVAPTAHTPSAPTRIPARSRAASSLSTSSRPPLTANASSLPLAPPSPSPYLRTYPSSGIYSAPLPLSSPSFTRRERDFLATPPRTAIPSGQSSRPRGATVSSSSTTTTPGTWSYALGGTGGRAQRPRANTSITSTAQPPSVSSPRQDAQITLGAGARRDPVATPSSLKPSRTPAWDVFGRVEGAQPPTGVRSTEIGADEGKDNQPQIAKQ